MWTTDLLKKFKHLKLEIEAAGYQPPNQDDLFRIFRMLLGGGTPKQVPKHFIILPRMPDATTLQELRDSIPEDVKYEFVEALKPSTVNQIKFLMQSAGVVQADSKTTERHLTINATFMPGKEVEAYDDTWQKVSALLMEDGYPDTWEINCGETKIFRNRKIMEERERNAGIRDISIMDEDVLNLKIALGATQDVNEFLALLESKC